MTELVLAFPPPAVPLSQNRALKNGWRENDRAMGPWKYRTVLALAEPAIREELLDRVRRPRPVTVLVAIPFPSRRRRDPHNYTGTVVKAVVDGLVSAGIVPDDNQEWVTVLDPVLVVGSTDAIITIRDRDTLAT